MSNSIHKASKFIKIANQSLVGLDAVMNYQKYNKQHRDSGRALSYSLIATSASTLGSLAGGLGGIAVAGGLARIGLNHTLINAGLKTFGTLVGGVAAAKGIDSLYENMKPVKKVINYAGDQLSQKGVEITQKFSNMAKF